MLIVSSVLNSFKTSQISIENLQKICDVYFETLSLQCDWTITPMNRITTFLLSTVFAAMTLQGYANSKVEIIDQDIQATTISVNTSTVHVTGANGQTLEVYNIAGVRVVCVKVEGQDKRFDLNLPKGCYIVKVGKVVRKISINQ